MLRLHLVADDINTTSHADMIWRDKSTFGNDLKPHLAAPEVIEDAFNGHKALRFGFSDFFQDGVEGFSCMRLDPLSSDNLLTYGSMSHWSFPGVTVFAVIEPRPVPWGGDDDPLDFVFDFGEFPARGFGLAWHENERTLYSPTEHGGEVRRSAEPRENKKYVVAIQYTFGQDGHVRALTQFTTRLGRADLIDPTEINGAAQGFSVQGFTPATVAHEQSPFSVGCMSKENTAGGSKGKRVFRGDIAELRLYAGLLPLDEVFAIRDGLVDKYVPECERGCSLLTRRGLSQVDRYDEPAATAPTPEAYKCVADGECVSARYIRIYKTESAADKTINLLELAAWSSAFPDVNLAAGKNVTCLPACHHIGGGALLVDGSTNTDVALSCFISDCGAGDKSMEIDLGQEYLIDGVLIVNRLNAYRTRVEDMKVDFKDADGNVVLTTAAIASDKNGYDGYVMDLTKEGDSLNDAGEFDAWKYIPEGDVVEAASFDWRPYRRWCAVDEYWDGAACKHCPVATTSPGGDATVCCAADEYAHGSACVTCPAGSTKLTHVMCTCHADEFWNVTACATCPAGQFSLGGAETTTSCITCNADEYWNGQGCTACPGGSTGTGDGTLCTCATNQKWNGHACEDCPAGSLSAGGNATTTSCITCNANEYWSGQACVACPGDSVGAGGSATSCTCNDDHHAHWSGSDWSCAACTAPYVKTGSVVPQSTLSSDSCDDPPPCQRELLVTRVDGTGWGAPFYFTCGDVKVYAGRSNLQNKTVIPPNNIAWGSCPTGELSLATSNSTGFTFAHPDWNFTDKFNVEETVTCGCRKKVRITRTDQGATGWGPFMTLRCGGAPVEVIVGDSSSNTKDVTLFSPYNTGDCPSTFYGSTFPTDPIDGRGGHPYNFQLTELSGCETGPQFYDTPPTDYPDYQPWIYEPNADQLASHDPPVATTAKISFQRADGNPTPTPSVQCVDRSQTTYGGGPVTPPSALASTDIAVTCCYDADIVTASNIHRPGCASRNTYEEAVAHCASSNSVLCSNEQFKLSIGAVKGCGFDGYFNWIRDPC